MSTQGKRVAGWVTTRSAAFLNDPRGRGSADRMLAAEARLLESPDDPDTVDEYKQAGVAYLEAARGR